MIEFSLTLNDEDKNRFYLSHREDENLGSLFGIVIRENPDVGPSQLKEACLTEADFCKLLRCLVEKEMDDETINTNS